MFLMIFAGEESEVIVVPRDKIKIADFGIKYQDESSFAQSTIEKTAMDVDGFTPCAIDGSLGKVEVVNIGIPYHVDVSEYNYDPVDDRLYKSTVRKKTKITEYDPEDVHCKSRKLSPEEAANYKGKVIDARDAQIITEPTE